MKSLEVHGLRSSRTGFAPRQDGDGSGGWGRARVASSPWPLNTAPLLPDATAVPVSHLAVPLSAGLVRRVRPGHCRDTETSPSKEGSLQPDRCTDLEDVVVTAPKGLSR